MQGGGVPAGGADAPHFAVSAELGLDSGDAGLGRYYAPADRRVATVSVFLTVGFLIRETSRQPRVINLLKTIRQTPTVRNTLTVATTRRHGK